MLATYETLTAALIQPASSGPSPLISTAVLDTYINIARNQVAADAECIRVTGTLALVANTQSYGFARITVPTAFGVGIVMTVRSMQLGPQPIDIRGWEWFAQYYFTSEAFGTPVRASQQGQGEAGTLFFHPIPTAAATVFLDVVCLPEALVDDTTPEAIPLLWTDAVPFWAAWLAFLTLQRPVDAEQMMQNYMRLVRRGRQVATPSELPDNLPGGMGTQLAATHQTLAAPQAAPTAAGR